MQFVAIAVVCLIGLFIVKRLVTLLASRDKPNDIHDVVEDVALASRVAAVIGGVSVYFLAPAGLLAAFTKPPLIVAIAPALAVFATGAYVLYALAKLYDKKRKRLNNMTHKLNDSHRNAL